MGGHPRWYVQLLDSCGDALAVMWGGALADKGAPWLVCGGTLDGMWGTPHWQGHPGWYVQFSDSCGGALAVMWGQIDWCEWHPGWCGWHSAGCEGALVGMGASWLVCATPWFVLGGALTVMAGRHPVWYVGGTLAGVLVPSFHKGRQSGSREEQYFDPGRGISVGKCGCRQGLALGSLGSPRGQQPPAASKRIEEPRGAHWGCRVGGVLGTVGGTEESRGGPGLPLPQGRSPRVKRPQVWAQLDLCEPHLLFIMQGRQSSRLARS